MYNPSSNHVRSRSVVPGYNLVGRRSSKKFDPRVPTRLQRISQNTGPPSAGMSQFLKPERLDVEAGSPIAQRKWKHWYQTFKNYVDSIEDMTDINKLNLLINNVDSTVYNYISEINNFEEAIARLESIFNRANEVIARNKLATCKQKSNQSLDEYLHILQTISDECNFVAVSAGQYRDEAIRDAFIGGISSSSTRQQLLQSGCTDLQQIVLKAQLLDSSRNTSENVCTAHSFLTDHLNSLCAENAKNAIKESMNVEAYHAINSEVTVPTTANYSSSFETSSFKKPHLHQAAENKGSYESVATSYLNEASPDELNQSERMKTLIHDKIARNLSEKFDFDNHVLVRQSINLKKQDTNLSSTVLSSELSNHSKELKRDCKKSNIEEVSSPSPESGTANPFSKVKQALQDVKIDDNTVSIEAFSLHDSKEVMDAELEQSPINDDIKSKSFQPTTYPPMHSIPPINAPPVQTLPQPRKRTRKAITIHDPSTIKDATDDDIMNAGKLHLSSSPSVRLRKLNQQPDELSDETLSVTDNATSSAISYPRENEKDKEEAAPPAKEDEYAIDPDTKKQYSRDFLMQLRHHNASLQKPRGLPVIEDIIMDRPYPKTSDSNLLPSIDGGMYERGGFSYFTLNYMRGGRNNSHGGWKKSAKKCLSSKDEEHKSKKLNLVSESKTALEPNSIEDHAGGYRSAEDIQTEKVLKQVQLILNELTPETFSSLMQKIESLPINTEARFRGVVDLIYQKAVDEPNSCEACANMCRTMSQFRLTTTATSTQAQQGTTTVEFRKILLTRCQREFEKDRNIGEKLTKLRQKLENSTTSEGKQLCKDEIVNAVKNKQRELLGNIRFIGEIFKLRMLTESVMHNCIMSLFKGRDDESLECLCLLLKSIGKDLDHVKGKQQRMDQYLQYIDKIIKETKTSPRVRFMLQDVVNLRKNKWVERVKAKGPKTIDHIHDETKTKKQQQARVAASELREMQLLGYVPSSTHSAQVPQSPRTTSMQASSPSFYLQQSPKQFYHRHATPLQTFSPYQDNIVRIWTKGRKVITIRDPSTMKDVTDDIMQSGKQPLASSPSVRSATPGQQPVAAAQAPTDQIVAQFAHQVAVVAAKDAPDKSSTTSSVVSTASVTPSNIDSSVPQHSFQSLRSSQTRSHGSNTIAIAQEISSESSKPVSVTSAHLHNAAEV